MKKKTQNNAAYSYTVMGLLIGTGFMAVMVFLELVFQGKPITFELVVEAFRDSPTMWIYLVLPFLFAAFGYYTGHELQHRIDDLSNDIANEQSKSRMIFDFVEKMRQGQTDVQYDVREGDEIGKSLINLRDELKRSQEEENIRKNEDKERHWITEGMAKFGAILRENIGDLDKLSNEVVMNLVQYVNAQQAGFFILSEKDDGKKYFKMTASYAYGRKKFPDGSIEWGEGLVGACALEQKTIYIKETKDDYVKITSGLGKSNPRSLVIVPLKFNDEIYGVVELASFIKYQPYEIEFIERVAESIASTISTVNINIRTAQLLKESQEQAEAMVHQEEEMRKNMDALKHTQIEAARQSEQFISFTNSVNHTMIRAEYTVDGFLTYANQKFLTKLGYTSSSEIEGKHISMFISDKDRAWFNDLWQNLASGGKHFEGDMKHVTKTGTDVWTMATYVSVRDHKHNPVKILFLGIDITESKKESLDYKGQIDALNRSTMKAEYGPDGRVLEMNAKLKDTLLYTPDELKKRTIFNFLTATDLEDFKLIWKNIINGVPFEGRHKWIMKTGEERWFQGTYTVVHDMYGEPAKIVFIGNDITDQIRIEEKNREYMATLREQEQKLQQSQVELSKKLKEAREEVKSQFIEVEIVKNLSDKTLEGLLDAVVTINQDNKITLFNRAAEELWGISRNNVLQHDISELLPTENIAAEDNYLGNFFRSGDKTLVGKRTEVFIVDKQGESINVLVTLASATRGERSTLTAFIQKIEVELIVGGVTGLDGNECILHPDRRVEIDNTAVNNIIKRISDHEPLEYVFNSAQFLDIELFTNSNVLIPRPETEELALKIVGDIQARLQRDNRVGDKPISILDIGTGSGCIPVYLATKFPGCQFSAIDISDDALATARSNAERHGCNINFIKADILDYQTSAMFDIIVSNPPYVLESEKSLMQPNVLDYEPDTALFVPDDDPLKFYRAISKFAVGHLNDGGKLYFEINEKFGVETAELMRSCGFQEVEVIKDLFDKDRFVVGM